MNAYFSLVEQNYWTVKNQAHADALGVAKEMDRILIDETELEQFYTKIREKISKVNEKNRRCKDLVVEIWTPFRSEDPSIQISGIFHMSLRKVNTISDKIRSNIRYNPSLDEALNSGDGVYRP